MKPSDSQRALAVHGYVVVGPRGMFPGTFRVSRDGAKTDAEGIILLNRYKAGEVWIMPAVLLVPPAAADCSRWGICQLEPSRCDELDAQVAKMQQEVQREANRVRRGKRR